MKRTQILITLGALALLSGAASAQSARTAAEQRCQQLAQEVNAEFQQAVQARMPKEDPGTFNQNGYDIKNILMQDSSAGLWKLAQVNFGNIMQNLVQRGMQQAMQKGQQNFSARMNGLLGEVGIKPVAFQQAMSSAAPSYSNVATPTITPQSAGAAQGKPGALAASPYGPTPKR